MISPDHAAFPVRHDLTIPTHPELIGALGRLAMAYIHLDIVLKYTFKTLSGMSVKDALDQMHQRLQMIPDDSLECSGTRPLCPGIAAEEVESRPGRSLAWLPSRLLQDRRCDG